MIKDDSESDSFKKFVRFLLRLVYLSSEVSTLITGYCGKHTPSGKHLFYFFFLQFPFIVKASILQPGKA